MILDPNTSDGIPLIFDANEAACQMHGYTKEDFIGRPVADIDDEEGKRLCLERTQEIMTGKPFYVENVHLRQDGSTFNVAVNAQRIDVRNSPPLILTVEYDITDRVTSEQELVKHRDHLDELVAEKTESLQKTMKLMVGRELRMAELKKKIKELQKQLLDLGHKPIIADDIP